MAVGSWDGSALVYAFTMGKDIAAQMKNPMRFERTDRVFDVCLSEDATLLLIAGRDCKATLYNLNQRDATPVEFDDADRVYCAALSPQGTYLAYGGIAKQVKVFMVAGKVQLNVYKHENTVHRMEFFGESHLIAISEDGRCVIYDVTSSAPFLQLKLDGIGNSVCVSSFEKGFLAVAHGRVVSVYGSHKDGYGPLDRPSFHMVREMMDDPESLRIALNTHPTLANAFSSDKDTLLHSAVRKSNNKALKILLKLGVQKGLLENKESETALHIAVEKSNRIAVEDILGAINSKMIVNTPDIFASMLKTGKFHDHNAKRVAESQRLALTKARTDLIGSTHNGKEENASVFEMIGKNFPDSLLKFLANFQLEESPQLIMGELTHACLQNPFFLGLARRCPKGFWESYYKDNKTVEEAFSISLPPVSVQAYHIPFTGLCGLRAPMDDKERENVKLNANGMFGLMSFFIKQDTKDQEQITCKPLDIIVEAARVLRDYSVFSESTIVHAMVMYKWSVVGEIFKKSFYRYLVYLALASLEGAMLAHTTDVTHFATLTNWKGILCYTLSPILICWSGYYMWRELQQFLSEYEAKMKSTEGEQRRGWWQFLVKFAAAVEHHFVSDPWNVLDFSAFTLQLLTNILVFTRVKGTLAVASCSILLLYLKILFYARGYKVWGPFVRMIQRTMMGMSSFVLVLAVVLAGFAMSFSVLLHHYEGFQTLGGSMLSVTKMIYGDFSIVESTFSDWEVSGTSIFLFEVMMLFCVVLMLNLLIAILSESYNQVKEHASQETVFELANIVIELERVNKFYNRNAKFFEDLFPTWVHVLKQSENSRILDEENAINTRLKEISEAQKEGMEFQAKLMEKLSAMESKMLQFEGSLNSLQVE